MDIAKEVAGLILSKEFLLRCAISGGIAGALYLVFGATFHYFFTRKVDRNIYDWRNGYSDIMLGACATPPPPPRLPVAAHHDAAASMPSRPASTPPPLPLRVRPCPPLVQASSA